MATWTPERVAYLTRRWSEGASGGVIARELDLQHFAYGGRSAVIGKVQRLGLPSRETSIQLDRTPNLHNAWAPGELKLLRSLWARGLSGSQISRRLGRTRSAVIKKAWLLGLKRAAVGPYNPARDAKPEWLERSHARA